MVEAPRQELLERIAECKMRVAHIRRTLVDGWRLSPLSFVEHVDKGRFHAKAAAIGEAQRLLAEVDVKKPTTHSSDVVPWASLLKPQHHHHQSSEQRLLAWCTALVRNALDVEARLAALAGLLTSSAPGTLPAELVRAARVAFGVFGALQATRRSTSADAGAMEEERRAFAVGVARAAVAAARQQLQSLDDDLGIAHAPVLYRLSATADDILPPPPPPQAKSRPATPVVPPSSSSSSSSSAKGGKRASTDSRGSGSSGSRAPSPLPPPPPAEGSTEGAWQYAKALVDEVLQDSLLLEGSLFVELKGQHAAQQTQQGVLSPRWFTNREHLWMLQYFQSERKGAPQLGTIDLTTVQSISFARSEDAASSESGRALCIVLAAPTGSWVLSAATERDAVFWMLGLKRILLDQSDGLRRASASTPATTDCSETDESITASACADPMLQIDHTYLLRRLDELSGDLLAVEQQLRLVNSAGDRLQQQFYALARRKAALQNMRQTALASLSKVETQMASKRGGGSKRKTVKLAPVTPSSSPSPQQQPGWAGAIKTPSGGSASSPQTTLLQIDAAKGVIGEWMQSSAYQRLSVQKVAIASRLMVPSLSLAGPELGGSEAGDGDSVFAKVLSCYPLSESAIKALGSKSPESIVPPADKDMVHIGDPICDRFAVHVVGRRVIAVIADGCNWGTPPLEAATTASLTFAKFVLDHHHKITDTRAAGDLLLIAVAHASDKISEGKDSWQVGTTTLAGGILLEQEDAPSRMPFVFVCVSLGDCKVFHYSPKTGVVVDITENNRLNLTDPSDPGGRLGPHLPGGNPDIRNLRVQSYECDVGDLIFICSDGVHDNFDPQHLGDSPRDWGLSFATWEEASDKAFELTQEKKAAFRANHLKRIICEGLRAGAPVTPRRVATSLVEFSYRTTASSRKWMNEHPKQKLPSDFVQFPGKLDHASCVCFRVGDV